MNVRLRDSRVTPVLESDAQPKPVGAGFAHEAALTQLPPSVGSKVRLHDRAQPERLENTSPRFSSKQDVRSLTLVNGITQKQLWPEFHFARTDESVGVDGVDDDSYARTWKSGGLYLFSWKEVPSPYSTPIGPVNLGSPIGPQTNTSRFE